MPWLLCFLAGIIVGFAGYWVFAATQSEKDSLPGDGDPTLQVTTFSASQDSTIGGNNAEEVFSEYSDPIFGEIADALTDQTEELSMLLDRAIRSPDEGVRMFAVDTAEVLPSEIALPVFKAGAVDSSFRIRDRVWAAMSPADSKVRGEVIANAFRHGDEDSFTEALVEMAVESNKTTIETVLSAADQYSDEHKIAIADSMEEILDQEFRDDSDQFSFSQMEEFWRLNRKELGEDLAPVDK